MGLVLACCVPYAIACVVPEKWKGGERLMQWIARRRNARLARLEAELDRKQEELRRTILNLAEELGMEGYEARKALIRESYRASGTVPDRPD